MKFIESIKNPQVKQWKKLLTKKERDKTAAFLVEGFHLVEEALYSNKIVELIVDEQIKLPSKWKVGEIRTTLVTSEIIHSLSDTEAPQGVIAVCRQNESTYSIEKGNSFLLIDAVQDPGNLGTMIRTADAAGVDAVLIGEGTVDVYNPKVLRSAQGSHFHLPIIKGNLIEWITKLTDEHIPVYGTALENGKDFNQVSSSEKGFALIVGNEGNGVAKEILALTTSNLYIPIYGKSESLNVAVAAGILLYHLRK
ncbi:RNA methyltransferase [Bacillus sp. 03113]|uniref:TrmH family RNA methyltransferase n=1 Tax=Bacillus sp. 03113 TaxID=2578211 RepID=UPI001144F53F|nr:RNA methyltransferase [Bacillus sp. 03113]